MHVCTVILIVIILIHSEDLGIRELMVKVRDAPKEHDANEQTEQIRCITYQQQHLIPRSAVQLCCGAL